MVILDINEPRKSSVYEKRHKRFISIMKANGQTVNRDTVHVGMN